jgi:glycosyltransferase involved in cell wall biosynthesis
MIINDLNFGGAEIQLLQLVKKNNNKNKILVLSLISIGNIGEKISDLGIEVESLNLKLNTNFILGFIKAFKIIKAYKPDVVHTWMYHSNIFGGFVAKFFGVQNIIWSIHHNDLTIKNNKTSTIIVAKLGAFFSKRIPNKIVCVSESVKKNHIDFGYDKNKIIVIYNGIDTEEFSFNEFSRNRVISEFNLNNKNITIGFFCRYDIIKNFRGFLLGIKLLEDDQQYNYTFNILMAGNNVNNDNTSLKNLIHQLKFKSRIYLLGPRHDMASLYNSIDIFVNASFNEAFSLTLVEALSSERICISSIEGDPLKILEGIGEYFPANDSNLLKEAILRSILKSPIEIQNSKQLGKKLIESSFSIETLFNKYSLIYNN